MAEGGFDRQLMTMLEYDWVSNTSMTHLSFLLRHALFVQQPLQVSVMERIREYEDVAESEFRNDPDLSVLCTGCSFEGIFAPTHASSVDESHWSEQIDTNYIYVFRKWTIDEDVKPAPAPPEAPEDGEPTAAMLGLERSSKSTNVSLAQMVATDQQGKVRLRLRTASQELSKFSRSSDNDESTSYLSGSLLHKHLICMLDNARKVNVAAASVQAMAVSNEGPPGAARPAWSEVSDQQNTISQGRVTFGFACPAWPEIAQAWESRVRRHEWPDQSDVRTVVSAGCHVTFTATSLPEDKEPTNGEDLLWSISFANAERVLVHSLLTAQRKAYVILLSLCQENIQTPAITPYHLRHVVFWTCEESTIGIWREDNLAECLLLLIDRLLHFLCMGDLPNFFVPEMNLFKDVKSDVMMEAIKKVSIVRQRPLAAHNACYRDVRTITGVTYAELFQPVLTYMEEAACGAEDEHPLESIVQTAFEVGHVYLTTGDKDRALLLFEEGCEIMLQISHPDQRSLQILQLTAWLYVQAGLLEKAIEYYEIIYNIVKTGEFPDFPIKTCLSNLACLYHAKSFTCRDEMIRQHLVTKARGCFEIAVKDDFDIQTVVHYAMFLLKHKLEKQALEVLLKAQEATPADITDDDMWEQTSSFMEVEADTLDEDLGNEVREAGELAMPTCCLTQYLLSKAMITLDLSKEARDSNEALRRLCKSPLNDYKDISCSMLGYCYKAMNNFVEAENMFREAIAQNKYNYIAEEQMQLCQAKCDLSIDTEVDTDNS